MKFLKYHGLGNDYLVAADAATVDTLTPEQIRLICHRNLGLGSDGILVGLLSPDTADFRLRIFNPDGSEAEKSGNGLRIFCRYLFDNSRVEEGAFFTIETAGGIVRAQVLDAGSLVRVSMGTVRFDSESIPVAGKPRDVIQEDIDVLDRRFFFSAATIGNPHCVILVDEPSAEEARKYGPIIEVDKRFPNRTNVQFMKIINRHCIKIEIWERGAGYTLASGSSSCAAAAVARKLGMCDAEITVRMPGGELDLIIDDLFSVEMVGPVQFVGEMKISKEAFNVSSALLG